MLPSRLPSSLQFVALLSVWAALGCSGSAGDRGGAGGAEVCTWCAPEPPRLRVCRAVMIASGGQRVCVDQGETWLCQPAHACEGDAGP